ncbi:MAG: aminotransferase class I/II-fold pyridoxal phosphate-dependent enzyme [Puniceicoccales bacterium]|jgi:LL-diaminopimelate aminotransferase|nr:aminotransferase class I/II-fold pyridoxal phosphate-dependent enzyme [Puniceicoccales bacterium]
MELNENFAKNFFATRIGGENFLGGNQIYKFEKIKRAKRNALEKFPSRILIDMGVGEPDEMASDSTIEALHLEARKYENRHYADNGCDEFREAAAGYMKAQFNVSLSPQTEIVHSIGIKAALSILPLCFINPGDVVLMPLPGYPIFGTHAKYLMADVIGMPLRKSNNYLPDFEDIPESILKKTKVVVVNYPNNPTGACATKKFFEELVRLAHKYKFLIINDAAYAPLTFCKEDRISIFNAAGAKEVALELHSMSKGFNMTGWRLGWVCGNEKLVRAYAHVKDQSDSGQFLAIQKAAAQTLSNLFIPENNVRRYSDRMDKIVPILKNCGFDIAPAKAGFFLYMRIPLSAEYSGEKTDFLLAEEFAQWMLEALGIVVVPWDDIEPAVRFSMTFGTKDMSEDEVINMFRDRLSNVRFKFRKAR